MDAQSVNIKCVVVARLRTPTGAAVDSAGNVYVANFGNNTIARITAAGRMSVFAGIPEQSGSDDGAGRSSTFAGPRAVAIDMSGNLYVADAYNSVVRRISTDAVVSTIAGSAGRTGSADGKGSAARFFLPGGIAADAAGNLYVADAGNHNVRKIAPTGFVSTIAGAAAMPGCLDGDASAARFDTPYGIAVDRAGVLYVADQGNNTIRMVSADGRVTTLAGLAGEAGFADGVGASARFFDPQSVAVDGTGNVYVADSGNQVIRRISPDGMVTTLARTPPDAGIAEVVPPDALRHPAGLALCGSTLYACDLATGTVMRIALESD